MNAKEKIATQDRERKNSTVLITGGHGGIGLECSKRLASARQNVILAGRSLERMESIVQQLQVSYGIKVHTLELDLSSLSSVRSAAARCRAMIDNNEIGSLQAILCNAGGRFEKVSYTDDGYETTFATNCLGHFLLVELLMDCVKPDGRVVFTASGTHDPDTMDGKLVGAVVEPDAVALANDGKNGAKPTPAGKRYSTSKLCNILEAYELHRRLQKSGSSITSVAYDPGSTPGTDFLRGMPKPLQWLSKTSFMEWLSRRLGVTIGSLTFSGAALADLAIDPKYAGISGKYFQSNDGRLIERRSSTLSYDEFRGKKLWEDMKSLAHLSETEEPTLLR